MTWAASALTLLVSACGGSSGSGASEADTVRLSGTAAVGAALNDAAVEVKCANGSGTAKTASDGTYALNVPGGRLPCVIAVTQEVNGVSVTLHSVTEAGTSSDGVTQATANVTPLTELIVAQLSAGLPSAFFASVSSGATISTAQLQQATSTILAALSAEAGINATAIDPFKAPLVAAGGGRTGNAYDQLLDQLGTKVSVEALPTLVAQVANTAATTASTGGETPTLVQVMASAGAGTLPGCPAALSGKYRTIDFVGVTRLLTINFAAGTVTRADGSTSALTYDAANRPCEFDAENRRYYMGPSGGGAFRALSDPPATGVTPMMGYVFPAQAHPATALTGGWTLVQSGRVDIGAASERLEHLVSRATLGANGVLEVCEYDSVDNPVCVDPPEQLALESHVTGGFDLKKGGVVVARLWAFRAPNGALSVFGTTNAPGVANLGQATHFVAVPQRALALPAVGSTSKSWNVTLKRNYASGVQTGNSSTPATQYMTVSHSAVDAGAFLVTRQLTYTSPDLAPTSDQLRFNYPLAGLRYRASTPSRSASLQLPLNTGAVINLSDSQAGGFTYGVAVMRP